MKTIVTVGLSPTLQKTILFGRLDKGEVNRSNGYFLDPSGKAVNAGKVLAQLGHHAVVNICPIGRDNSALFMELAARDRLVVLPVPIPGATRHCYTLIDQAASEVTELVVSEPVSTAPFERYADELYLRVEESLGAANALLMAGSRPSFWPHDAYARLSELGRKKGIPVMADFHGQDLLLCLETSTPSIIKINERELCETFSLPYPLAEHLLEKELAALSTRYQCAFVVTRGTQATWAAREGKTMSVPVEMVTAVNTTGCGDAFGAGFLDSFIEDKDLANALSEGSRCARLKAEQIRPGSILNDTTVL